VPRLALWFVGLFVLLCSALVFGQPVVEEIHDYQEPPLPPPLPLEITPENAPEVLAEPLPVDTTEKVEEAVECPCVDTLDEFWGYRYAKNSMGWIVGDGDQFGMVSLGSNHFQSRGEDCGLGLGLKFHFLAGPERTDMPPHVFDFSLAWQRRKSYGSFGYDVAVSAMASSDFEGSSRQGIRFPGHAVGFLRMNSTWDLVLGVDYLDRGDVKLLPVAGLIVLPHPDVRLELVFPRPRIVFQLAEKQRLSIAGELGGGSWAIERTSSLDDLATYRDLRLSIGLERFDDDDGQWSTFEISYIFDRKLEYTSGIGDYRPRDTVMILMGQTF
jgi:hypothetical protein